MINGEPKPESRVERTLAKALRAILVEAKKAKPDPDIIHEIAERALREREE
jgi:hypothetical protein